MKTFVYSTGFTLILSLLCFFQLTAQDVYRLDESSTAKIQGTSTLHDWESVIEKTTASLTVNSVEANFEISEMEVAVEARSIKSGKDVMDMKTYNALRSVSYPSIIFTLNTPVTISDEFEVTAEGTLQLAGITKEIMVNGKVNNLSSEQFGINANYTINMTEYDIEPPTAMFGTIVTGEEITVVFEMVFIKVPDAN